MTTTTDTLTRGSTRTLIDAAELAKLRSAGVLVEDSRRERPRYFDGRFLAARDLIRDQQYFLTREADLGRGAGSGVTTGLHVRQGATPHELRVSAGQGITPTGELVLLPEQLTLNLADVPFAEQLSASFGLSRIPAPPLRSRTGLFLLALRPVEFTANPVGAYPTSLSGPRKVEDGDIIEGTAVVLVPWNDDGASGTLEARRSLAARTIFTQAGARLASASVLPVAMLALQANAIVWLDEAMVRRELGADRGDMPGLGFSPRGLRLAHLMQYQNHLADVYAQLNKRSFPAASQFQALPPAGPLPAGVIDTSDFTQRFFPAEVDVDFSIIPEDELPALVEESLALPPIDFLASEAALDKTAVVILAPVPRDQYRAVMAKLESRTRVLKPAALNLVAQQKPLEILQRLRIPQAVPAPDVSNPSDAQWVALAKQTNLWFVRRRNLAYRDDLAGSPVAIAGRNDAALDSAVRSRVVSLGLEASLNKLLAASTSKAAASAISLLSQPRIAASPVLTAATIGALSAKAQEADGALDHASVLAVSSDLTSGTGAGLTRLEESTTAGATKSALLNLASNDAWRKLDSMAVTASSVQLDQLAARIAPAATTGVSASEEPAKEVAPTGANGPLKTVARPAATKKPAAKPVTKAATKAATTAKTAVAKSSKTAKKTTTAKK